ncbi:MAG: glycosyltransferase family 4 protein [Candidatus Omnitrophota bacterium]|nr:glycosyltransferase family 4 protein [Candidatus Omnitrophota bacterium]
MRILHVTKKYPNAIGGDATCVFNLERVQEKRGHKVFIATINDREIRDKANLYKFGLKDSAYNWDNVTLKRILSLMLFFPKSLFLIKKIKPDIIHSHSADLGFIISLWAKLIGIPVINTCHSASFFCKFTPKIKRYPELFLLRFGFFDKIITVAPDSKEIFHKYGLKNCEYLNMLGVDADIFHALKKEMKLVPALKSGGESIKLSNPDSRIRFIFVGRINPLKGLDYLMLACQRLKKEIEYFEVWVVGDGPYKKNLEKLSRKLNIESNIKFFGAITDRTSLIKTYCMADIFVFPSLLESFSLVILEAWAAGLAVITTKVGIIISQGKNEENVLIIRQKDADSLYQAMLRLIKDKGLREKIGLNGNKLLLEKDYTWENIATKLEHIYTFAPRFKAGRMYNLN